MRPAWVALLAAVALSAHARDSRMDAWFANDFADFVAPEHATIRQGAVKQTIAEASYDDVWNAVLVVAMQRNVIVRAVKETGLLISMEKPAGEGVLFSGLPTAVLVERAGPNEVTVTCNWPDDFYKWSDGGPGQKFEMKNFTRQRLGQRFLDRVVSQALIRQRWPYLGR